MVPVTGLSVPLRGQLGSLYRPSDPLTGALFDCLIVGHNLGFNCMGPWGASKNISLGLT